ncbi:MAG: hypothetical protein LBB48_06265 [Treponema sp.]|nr:hypothetical protein [Treponema sp.]
MEQKNDDAVREMESGELPQGCKNVFVTQRALYNAAELQQNAANKAIIVRLRQCLAQANRIQTRERE